MEDGSEAPRRGRVAPKRQAARSPGGESRRGAKTLRLQLHLGEKTVERLGVHCSLVHRDKSAVADEILTAWLGRYGKGRDLFPAVRPDLAGSDAEAPTE